MNENVFYDLVAQELQAQTMVPGLWTRAFSEAGGQLDRARALYIKHRVAQLVQEANEKLQQERRVAAAAARKTAADGLRCLIFVVLTAIFGLIAFILFLVGLFSLFDSPRDIGVSLACICFSVLFAVFTHASAKAAATR